MKKRISLLLFAALFVFGCAGISPWTDIPREEKMAWQGIGISAKDAKSFRQNGFIPIPLNYMAI